MVTAWSRNDLSTYCFNSHWFQYCNITLSKYQVLTETNGQMTKLSAVITRYRSSRHYIRNCDNSGRKWIRDIRVTTETPYIALPGRERYWGTLDMSYAIMMTSSNGNIFRVTGPLCGEFTGPGHYAYTKIGFPIATAATICVSWYYRKCHESFYG